MIQRTNFFVKTQRPGPARPRRKPRTGGYGISCLFAIVLSLACLAGDVMAEEGIPGSTQPGRIEKRFEQPPAPRSQPEVYIRTEIQIPPEKASQIQFVLTAIEFEGNTVFKQSDFSRFYDTLLTKTVSLNAIYTVADAVTAFYRNEGYILCQAIIPPQKITGGIVRIKIVEGYINEVIIEGDVRGRMGLFQDRAQKIKESRPLNIKVLERNTLLSDDLPGAVVRSVLRPAKDVPGAADLILSVDHKTLDASLGYDNRGTKSSGPYQATFTLGANSLLHLYEKTNLMYIATQDFKELNYFVLSHEETLTNEGTTLSLSMNHSRTRPGNDLEDYDIQGYSTSYTMGLTHPFIRARSTNLSTNLDFVIKKSVSETLDELRSRDRLRVLKAGVTYDFSDHFNGVNLINLEVHQGLNILDATKTGSDNLSRAEGHSNFTKFTTEISRTQYLADKLGLLLAGSGQYASCTLLSSEEFGYGGTQYGRAYDSSEITGDHGLAVKAEIQYTDTFSSSLRNYVRYYQAYAFADYGAVYSRSDPKLKNDSGASSGIGIRFGITDYIAGYLEIDKPMLGQVASANEGDGHDPRLFFSIAARY